MKIKKLKVKIKHHKKKLSFFEAELKQKKQTKRIGFIWYDKIF